MQLYLVDAIRVGKRTTADVHPFLFVDAVRRQELLVEVVRLVGVQPEHYALAGVVEHTGDAMLSDLKRLEMRVEEKTLRLDVDRRLPPARAAQTPQSRVESAPKVRTCDGSVFLLLLLLRLLLLMWLSLLLWLSLVFLNVFSDAFKQCQNAWLRILPTNESG